MPPSRTRNSAEATNSYGTFPQLRTNIRVPLALVNGGEVLGTLNLDNTRPDAAFDYTHGALMLAEEFVL
jgi:hypothetical protein